MNVPDGEFQIIDGRCPKCSWFVRLRWYAYDGFRDYIEAVWGVCKRHGVVEVTDYTVWP